MRKENLEIQHKIIINIGKESLENVFVTEVSNVILNEGYVCDVLFTKIEM